MKKIELTFDPRLKIKVRLKIDSEYTLSIHDQIFNIIKRFENIEKINEVNTSEQHYRMGEDQPDAHFITFNVDKSDEFIKMIKSMVKEKLISLVALVDVKTEDIIFINDDPSVEKLADNVKDNYKKK